jgi:hypothetical protein
MICGWVAVGRTMASACLLRRSGAKPQAGSEGQSPLDLKSFGFVIFKLVAKFAMFSAFCRLLGTRGR